MAGKSREARWRDKKLALDNLSRLARGTVTLLVWPVKASQNADGEDVRDLGRVWCSAACILWAMGYEYESHDPDENDLVWNLRRHGHTDTEPMLVPRGTWPLTRYLVRRHYAEDVDHFRCSGCGKTMRRTLTPRLKKAKTKTLAAKEAAWRREKRRKAAEARAQARAVPHVPEPVEPGAGPCPGCGDLYFYDRKLGCATCGLGKT